jgi:hypothetical protein
LGSSYAQYEMGIHCLWGDGMKPDWVQILDIDKEI